MHCNRTWRNCQKVQELLNGWQNSSSGPQITFFICPLMAEAWAQCKDRLDLIYLKLLKPAVEDFWFKLCEPLLSWSNALESSKIMLGCGKLQSPTQCFHYENYCTWEEKKRYGKVSRSRQPYTLTMQMYRAFGLTQFLCFRSHMKQFVSVHSFDERMKTNYLVGYKNQWTSMDYRKSYQVNSVVLQVLCPHI